jgi:hypothetical protein
MSEPQQTFETALADFVAECQRVSDKNAERFKNLHVTDRFETSRGPTYTRITMHSYSASSCYGFVRNQDGAVLYAAGQKPFKGKTEASTVRGNIFDHSTWERCIGPYGIRTIR